MSKHYRVADLHAHPELDKLLPPQSPDEYDAMKADIAANRIFQPLIVCRDSEGFVVIDGRHRLRAATELGLPEVPATLLDGLSEDERVERGVRLNNRRNMNPEQKRALAAALLRRWPERSDRWLAQLAGCSHPTVASVRTELVAEGQLERVSSSTGRDGKERPATKPARTGSITAPKPSGGNGRSKMRSELTPEEIAARGAALEAEGVSCLDVATAMGIHANTYRAISTVARLAEDEHLPPSHQATAADAWSSVRAGGSIEAAYQTVKQIADAKYGNNRGANADRRLEMRMAAVQRAVLSVAATCTSLSQVEVPLGPPPESRSGWLEELDAAIAALRAFRNRVKEA